MNQQHGRAARKEERHRPDGGLLGRGYGDTCSVTVLQERQDVATFVESQDEG